MAKIERKFMAHFIDTTFTFNGGSDSITWTPSWDRLGEDWEEYSIELNPILEVEKNFRGEDVLIHTGYDMSADAEPYYAYNGDALFSKLQSIIDNSKYGANCLTLSLEVHLWISGSTPGSSTYHPAILRPCYVVPSGFGGDTSGYQIPFSVNYLNNFSKSGTFTPNGSGGGTFTAT